MTLAVIASIASALIGGLIVAHNGRVHAREIARLERLLAIEQDRTADLLTRLAARSLEQYHAVAREPEVDDGPAMRHLYDSTGLVQLSERVD